MTNTAADKAETLLRKRFKAEAEIALVNKRCYSLFRSMLERATEAHREHEIDFDVEKLREFGRGARGITCRYCGKKLTAKSLSFDHSIPISRGGSFNFENLSAIDATCNKKKGSLTPSEFFRLLEFLQALDAPARADIYRRLGNGGARFRA